MGAQIFRKENPVPGMGFLLPSLEVTEMENILMFKDLAVYMKVFGQTLQLTGDESNRSFLKKARIPVSSACR